MPIHDRDLPHETVDVFDVVQLTHDTPLQSTVAADLVQVGAGSRSGIHRHNDTDTVLYMVSGAGGVVLGGPGDQRELPVVAGDRVLVGRGVFHGITTGAEPLVFLSVQSPPILDHATGHMDFEPLQGSQQVTTI